MRTKNEEALQIKFQDSLSPNHISTHYKHDIPLFELLLVDTAVQTPIRTKYKIALPMDGFSIGHEFPLLYL